MEQSQALLKKSVRELERDQSKMQEEEDRLKVEIRMAAKRGQTQLMKSKAKDLIRTRNAIAKSNEIQSNLRAVSRNIQTLVTTAAMTEALKGATVAMYRINKQVNLPAIQHMMMEFEKQSGMMDMKQELMDETIDSVNRQEDDDAKEAEAISQVMDELSIGLVGQFGVVPSSASRTPLANEDDGGELRERINALRK